MYYLENHMKHEVVCVHHMYTQEDPGIESHITHMIPITIITEGHRPQSVVYLYHVVY